MNNVLEYVHYNVFKDICLYSDYSVSRLQFLYVLHLANNLILNIFLCPLYVLYTEPLPPLVSLLSFWKAEILNSQNNQEQSKYNVKHYSTVSILGESLILLGRRILWNALVLAQNVHYFWLSNLIEFPPPFRVKDYSEVWRYLWAKISSLCLSVTFLKYLTTSPENSYPC